MLVDVFTVFRICVNNIIISAFVDDSIGHLYIKSIWKILYHKSCKYSDREAGAHSVDPYHTAPMGAVWLGLHCMPLLIWLFYLLLASTLLHLEICVPFFLIAAVNVFGVPTLELLRYAHLQNILSLSLPDRWLIYCFPTESVLNPQFKHNNSREYTITRSVNHVHTVVISFGTQKGAFGMLGLWDLGLACEIVQRLCKSSLSVWTLDYCCCTAPCFWYDCAGSQAGLYHCYLQMHWSFLPTRPNESMNGKTVLKDKADWIYVLTDFTRPSVVFYIVAYCFNIYE